MVMVWGPGSHQAGRKSLDTRLHYSPDEERGQVNKTQDRSQPLVARRKCQARHPKLGRFRSLVRKKALTQEKLSDFLRNAGS